MEGGYLITSTDILIVYSQFDGNSLLFKEFVGLILY